MTTLMKICDGLKNLFDIESDQRTSKMFLMSSPLPVLLISLTYLINVQILFPRYMENRKAFDIKQSLRFYNLWHLSINIIFFYLSCSLGWLSTYSWRCEPVNRSSEGIGFTIAKVSWWFLMFKFTDFLETLILVCGKRYELITKYHVIHHFLLPNMIWGAVKFVPGGHATFFAFINTFVHSITYGYL
ncbi:CLUMA_CG014283, isoform A, partial [Clunio marinus]